MFGPYNQKPNSFVESLLCEKLALTTDASLFHRKKPRLFAHLLTKYHSGALSCELNTFLMPLSPHTVHATKLLQHHRLLVWGWMTLHDYSK